MRILVTGAAGFAGKFLADELSAHGHEVIGVDLAFREASAVLSETHAADLRDAARITEIIAATLPDACVHLGAIAFVPAGKSNPEDMLAVNIMGTLNVLEAFREHAPQARILVVSTAHIYGPAPKDGPVAEDAPLAPESVYAVSKAAADTAALACVRNHNLQVIVARPTNHTGPGQQGCFVIPAFAQQLTAIATGSRPPVLHVGNLESERDFLDVRDVVRAYRLLLEKGRIGHAYNIGGQPQRSIGAILKQMCDLLHIEPEIIVDEDKYRPTDRSPDLNVTKLVTDTGWNAEFDLSQTIRDMLTRK